MHLGSMQTKTNNVHIRLSDQETHTLDLIRSRHALRTGKKLLDRSKTVRRLIEEEYERECARDQGAAPHGVAKG